MAKIELHVTAEDAADFYDTLTALARAPVAEYLRQPTGFSDQTEERPTPAAPETTEAKRTRRTKAQIEADNAALTQSPKTAPVFAPTEADTGSAETPSSTEPEVTLADVNAKMTALMAAQPGCTAKIQEIVKQATNGKYGSPKAAFVAGEGHFLPIIMAGLEAL